MKEKPPRIAYFIADAQVCGGVAVVCQHANRLARRGFDACIISTAGDEAIDWFPGLRVPVHPLSRAPRGIDIGVATWWETTHHLFRADIPRKFYFVQSDETRFYPEGGYEREFARASYRLDWEYLTEARWIREWLMREFGKSARYVPNGVDRDIFHPAEPLEPKGGKPRILIEGPADMASKGVAESFRAAGGLGAEVWYVNYRGAPDPAWAPDRYFYRVPMDEMRRIYSSCDVLLKLSTVEGASGPPLEMMACGGVCVVARVTGADEALVDGENALLVPPGDIEGARAALMRLMSDAALRERLAEGGRAAVEKLDWEKTADLLAEIYLSAPPSRSGAPEPGMAREERVLMDIYRLLKTREREQEVHIASLRAEAAALRHDLNLKNDELNSVYLSKQWRIAEAVKAARHSPVALAKLPFRLMRGRW